MEYKMRKEINKFKDFLNENSKEKLNISEDSKISELIKRKLDGGIITEEEFLQLHNWLMKNDSEYSDSVIKQLKKDMKKHVPKGTKIE